MTRSRADPNRIAGIFARTPPILRKYEWLFHVGSMVFLAVILLGFPAVLRTVSGTSPPPMVLIGSVAIGSAAMGLSAGIGLAGKLASAVALSRVKVRDYLLCGKCGHDLRGIQSSRCPECGAPASADRVRSFWKRFLRVQWLDHNHDRPLPRPPWLVRQASLGALIVVAFWVSAFVAIGLVWPFAPVAGWVVGVAFFFVLQWSLAAVASWRSQRLCRRLLRETGLVCTKCGSSVVGMDDCAECPKCRTQFVRKDLAATWECWRPACWDVEMASD